MNSLAIVLSSLAIAAMSSGKETDWEDQIQIGVSFMSRGNYSEAKRHFEVAANSIRSLPIQDERHALTANYLGVVYDILGGYPQAEVWYRRSLAVSEGAAKRDYGDLAIVQSNLANAYRKQGRLAKADETCRRALESLARHPSPQDYAQAHVLGTLGSIASDKGDLDAAERALSEAAHLTQGLHADATRLDAYVLNNLALVYRRQGKREQALSTLLRAYSAIGRRLGDSHPELFEPLTNIAVLQAEAGDVGAALNSIESAIRLGEKALGPENPSLGVALQYQARLLRKLKRKNEALALEKRASEIRRNNEKTDVSRHVIDIRDRRPAAR